MDALEKGQDAVDVEATAEQLVEAVEIKAAELKVVDAVEIDVGKAVLA